MWEVFETESGIVVFTTRFKWLAWVVSLWDRKNWDWDREHQWSGEVWELPSTWK